jgi:hypothetical protein
MYLSICLKISSPPRIITWQRAPVSLCNSEPTVHISQLEGSQNMSGFAHNVYKWTLLILKLEQLCLSYPSLFANSKSSARIQALFLLLNDLLSYEYFTFLAVGSRFYVLCFQPRSTAFSCAYGRRFIWVHL